MKSNKKIIITIILCIVLIFTSSIVFAHSGRTDSSGGHRDNKNKSGLGSYHYHCGGHPAHLHTNGVCPYSSSASSKSSGTKSTTSTSSSSVKKTSAKQANIEAIGIVINENLTNIKVGENKKITATISPADTTDKNISWKSSNENIAVINSLGELITKKSGTVEITASTSNGKESKITVVVEDEKEKNQIMQNTNNEISNTVSNTSDNSNTLAGLVGLGLIGGGGYWGYNKYKKSKH